MKKIQRVSSVILLIILSISTLLAGLYYFGGSIPDTIGTSMEEKSFTSLNLLWALLLFVAATAITMVFTFINIFSNPQIIKNFLIVFGLAGLLVLISYLTASSTPLAQINVDTLPTPTVLKWVGTGLNAAIILVVIAVAGIIITEILRGIRLLD
jgi:hypothetical protein